MDPKETFQLRWKGQVLGPYTREVIEQKLRYQEIGLFHEVDFQGRWISLKDFLGKVRLMEEQEVLQQRQFEDKRVAEERSATEKRLALDLQQRLEEQHRQQEERKSQQGQGDYTTGPHTDAVDQPDDDDLRLFVDNNADFYLLKWKVMHSTESSMSWNWSAFCFGVLWAAYRKMYSYTFVILVGFYIIGILELELKLPDVWAAGLSLSIWVLFGLFGNRLYYSHALKRIMEIKFALGHAESRRAQIAKKGGTSFVEVLAAGLLFVIAVFLSTLVGVIEEVVRRY